MIRRAETTRCYRSSRETVSGRMTRTGSLSWWRTASRFSRSHRFFGRARITGLARFNGYPAGVMANNPMSGGGSTDVAAGEKVLRLLQLCDTFHLPLVSIADEPGFMVGLDSERRGIERAGARLVMATCDSRMPWITVVTGQLYGVAGQCQHRPSGMFRGYAWPSANWGRCTSREARWRLTGVRSNPRRIRRGAGGAGGTPEGDRFAVPNGRGDGTGHHRPAGYGGSDLRVRGGGPAGTGDAAGAVTMAYRP